MICKRVINNQYIYRFIISCRALLLRRTWPPWPPYRDMCFLIPMDSRLDKQRQSLNIYRSYSHVITFLKLVGKYQCTIHMSFRNITYFLFIIIFYFSEQLWKKLKTIILLYMVMNNHTWNFQKTLQKYYPKQPLQTDKFVVLYHTIESGEFSVEKYLC